MDYRDREKIDLCCNRIAGKINMPLLWPLLLRYNVFHHDDVNVPAWKDVLHEENTVREILETIKTRGPYAFRNLLKCLRETNHNHIAAVLEGKASLDSIENVPNNNGEASNNVVSSFFTGGEPNFNYEFVHSDKPLVIDVTPAIKFMDDNNSYPPGTYKMRSNPHGYVLIISVRNYIHEEERIAAEYDEANLKKLFNDMGFHTILPEPGTCLTGEEINRTVREFSQREDFDKVDSCFVIICAHGCISKHNGTLETEIHGMDCRSPGYEKVLCNDLVEMFTDENCKGLKGKPKVFIFQSCRKIMEQKPSKNSEDATGKVASNSGKIASNSGKVASNSEKVWPNYTDMLITYSTIPGKEAYRNESTGSWYISVLCEVFMQYACFMEIHQLFKMINAIMKSIVTKDGKYQTPNEDFRGFHKNLYLNPMLFEDS